MDIRYTLRSAWWSLLLGVAVLAAPLSAWAADVWVNTGTGVYHCAGSPYYGNTKRGSYLAESAAITHKYRSAYNRPCSPGMAKQTKEGTNMRLAPAGVAASNKVWINSGSHVYHCPGTRYYGATKRGQFATEREAIASGNRPAHGAQCN